MAHQALIDASTIEGYLSLSGDVAAEVAKRLQMAQVYLRNLKGDAWYEALAALEGEDPGDHSLRRAEEAMALIAFWYALPHLNTRVSADGGIEVVTWTDDGSGVKTERRFSTMRNLDELRAELLSQAKLLIAGDVSVSYDNETEQNFITSVDGAAPNSGFSLVAVGAEEDDA